MKKIKMWYFRNFKIISVKTAMKLNLTPFRDIYDKDEIKKHNCRSIWEDEKGNKYKAKELIRFSGYFQSN